MICASRKLKVQGKETMAILLRFTPVGLTSAKYREVLSRLHGAGANVPPGRLFHVAFGDPNNLSVSEIWDSRESFGKFGDTLRPILGELGVNAGDPNIIEVNNVIAG